MTRFDILWGRLTRVLSFIAGLGIMTYETVGDSLDRPWLYAAAIGMMGLPIARAAEAVLGKVAGDAQRDPVDTPRRMEGGSK